MVVVFGRGVLRPGRRDATALLASRPGACAGRLRNTWSTTSLLTGWVRWHHPRCRFTRVNTGGGRCRRGRPAYNPGLRHRGLRDVRLARRGWRRNLVQRDRDVMSKRSMVKASVAEFGLRGCGSAAVHSIDLVGRSIHDTGRRRGQRWSPIVARARHPRSQLIPESPLEAFGRTHAFGFYSARRFSRTTATAWPEPMQIPITP